VRETEHHILSWVAAWGEAPRGGPKAHLYAGAIERLMKKGLVVTPGEGRLALTPNGLQVYTEQREEQAAAEAAAVHKKYLQDILRADENTQR